MEITKWIVYQLNDKLFGLAWKWPLKQKPFVQFSTIYQFVLLTVSSNGKLEYIRALLIFSQFLTSWYWPAATKVIIEKRILNFILRAKVQFFGVAVLIWQILYCDMLKWNVLEYSLPWVVRYLYRNGQQHTEIKI